MGGRRRTLAGIICSERLTQSDTDDKRRQLHRPRPPLRPGRERDGGARGAARGPSAISGMPIDRERHAADLKAALGGIKGPLMKVAQLLATIPDALPEEYVRELIQLQANAPAMGWPFVRRRMDGRTRAGLAEPFQELRARGGARRLARARCIAPSRSTARRSPANCNIPTWRRRSKPICAS